ncbi:urea carboxylase precursor [Solimonas aquatica]|uniref:Biotin carboxylase n=1 Tax=Solimonas aquatica TaxID=489703 RepID=A0A1H9GTB4_9GAMM|nr:5-oxoprolinase/urea amidolyase family protein [Solimonas aquatica]SEQ53366.1 urea carboxylase precursor [Solimonas aquatica]
MFEKVLIANRGEIAARVIRTLKKMGIASVAVYSDADRYSAPVLAADEAIRVGPAAARESYLNVEAIVAACRQSGAQAVHPGYGFLSENAGFAEQLAAHGIRFIGPRPEHLRDFGLKHTARALAQASGVPLLPGSGLLDSAEQALTEAQRIGYPVMLKSTAGGGGIGMHLCYGAEELAARFAAVQRMAQSSFGDARVYLERYVETARHIEVQIFGDGRGRVVSLGERDCSLQRRNQKVVEETPAPGLSDTLRARLHAAARALGEAVAYESAGTVEFIYDVAREDFYFLEVNTRLQVEHPVTEAVFGIDLVAWMIRQAAGELELPQQAALQPTSAAVEVRLYAENPQRNFAPSSGLLTELRFAPGIRVDGWIQTGTEVSSFYDPMLAKLIASGENRAAAIATLRAALDDSVVCGIQTNLDYLRAVLGSEAFLSGAVATRVLKDFAYQPRAIEVLAAGAQSSVQDHPGRLGYWDVGIPPSGPMDARSLQLANRAVGNAPGTAALECTLSGPTLRFWSDTVIALAGAAMQARLDEQAVPFYEPVTIKAGQTLQLGKIEGAGQRTYLAVQGGIAAPLYLGSRACFSLGGFGGHATGVLRAGDSLQIDTQPHGAAQAIAPQERPQLMREWTLAVLYGPHGAPDFFTAEDIDTLFAAEYEVHFNSARTGVRLIGPRPAWARPDGGEAGLHPSNIHDNAYAIGAIDFTGDMPIILGPDGPSLGGFVCPAVVCREDLWKLGQLKPGDKVRFRAAEDAQLERPVAGGARGSPIVAQRQGAVPVVYRRAGDDYLLVEYGPMMLDLALRLRVHLLMQALQAQRLPGVIDLTPGIRSLQIHYDSTRLKRTQLLGLLQEIEQSLPAAESVTVPSRIVHLPLSWNDSSVQLAMRKYQELVRPNAPWCPDNIEFIRRINGLGSASDVQRIVFDASYLVMGLGDVYLGAPVATPIDPRHRLVTTKYNPARTWTPENAVGIGGAYLCVYGMEGPGGYQLFGRTVQMWNRWQKTAEFTEPYLLRFFDQIRFYPVSEQELAEARAAFPHGRYPLRIEPTQLAFGEYAAFLAREAGSISAFKRRQQAAFEAERADWKARGLDSFSVEDSGGTPSEDALPAHCSAVASQVTGSVWKLLVQPGDTVQAGQVLLVLESMKMEMEVTAPQAGRVRELRCSAGRTVQAGQTVVVLEDA